ncbi:Gfo/Idh/MocA family protein [Trichormus azollae]|jgi:predicted dehydrogenase|uniref:Oxidoreductase domain protein n=1 Tax=Nostoc azollae (strain 0708) TaxID=551115 RepID=D7E1Z2_NOSA0|nr:Gfo/Idh/MocA family oxidoreductase [Trichormus azollae]ADI64913.1 oxidoreductase domain protein ['Nostoc azollae' 0708]
MTKIKLAVMGVGRWGVHLFRNFLAHPQVSVVAVVDPHKERFTKIKRQFDLDENVLLTTEWEYVKQIAGLTAVAIATPATTHYALIKDALHQGYHVLAEKPLTIDPEECRELCQIAEYQQLILMVDHTYLFHPAVEKGQTVVQSGQLGHLRYGYATRTHLGPVRQDVDALWDLAIHDIAIFNTWLGKLPIKVQATGTAWLQGNREVGENTMSTLPATQGLADLLWLTLTYPDNLQAYVHLCWLNPDKQRRLGIVGSQGSLIFDEMSASSPLTLIHGEVTKEGNSFIPVNQRQEVVEIEKAEPLGKVCDHFVSSVIQNTPSLISSGSVGRELVVILRALTTSLNQKGKSIKISNG